MKTKNIYLIIIALLLIFAIGCSEDEQAEEEEEENNVEEEEEQEEQEEDEPLEEEEEELTGTPSPLSGVFVEDEKRLNKPVVGVMFDNNPKARPQAGIYDAEVMYEFYVEGNATRYLGLFLINEPELIGPVRSARPYYIERAMEFNAIYTHAGASSRVEEEIDRLSIQNVSLLGPGGGAFWRESHKRAPHNAYTSMDNIRNTAKNLNYREISEFDGHSFYEQKQAPEQGEPIDSFEVRYHSSYRAGYEYNEETESYDRYYVDQQQFDETHSDEEPKPISPTNVLVQIVPARLIPGTSSGILEMDTIGSGKGYFFTMGEMVEVQWEKRDKEDLTRYYDNDGKEIILNPGQTWVQVISREDLLTIHDLDNEE